MTIEARDEPELHDSRKTLANPSAVRPSSTTGSPVGRSDISRKTIKGMGHLLGGSFTRAGLRIIVAGIFARLIDPSQFGIAAAAGIFTGLARTVAVSGIVMTLVQRPKLTDDEIRTAFTANIAASFVTTILICAFARLLADFFNLPDLEPVLYVASLAFPMIAVSGVSSKLLEREHRFSVLAWSDILSYVISYVAFGLPLALMNQGVWALILPAVLSNLLQSIILSRYHPHSMRPGFKLAVYKELMKTGAGYSLQRYVNIIATKGDYFIVGRLLGPTALGMYERAYVLMDVSNQLIMNGLTTALFPAFSRISHDRQRMRRALLRSMALLTLMFLPASAVLVVLGPEAVGILIGPDWGDAVLPFQILVAGLFLRNGYRIPTTVLNSMAKVRITTISQIAYSTTVVVGAIIGSSYGIVGVATSVLLAISLHFSILTLSVNRLLGISIAEMLEAMRPGMLFTVLFTPTAWPLSLWLREIGWPQVPLVALVGVVLGLLAIIVIRVYPNSLGEHGRDLARPVLEKIHRRLPNGCLRSLLLPPLNQF